MKTLSPALKKKLKKIDKRFEEELKLCLENIGVENYERIQMLFNLEFKQEGGKDCYPSFYSGGGITIIVYKTGLLFVAWRPPIMGVSEMVETSFYRDIAISRLTKKIIQLGLSQEF